MKRCTVAGIDAISRCNLHCHHCYYRFRQWAGGEISLVEAMALAVAGKERGCDSVVVEGQGEPALWTQLIPFIKECKLIDMEVQIITNGTAAVSRYESFYAAGLNHMLVSVHHIGKWFDGITGVEGSFARQQEVLKWLHENNLPWRSNTTIQQFNYEHLPEIAEYMIGYGAFHVVLLGFLPHYELGQHVREIAEHPGNIRLYAERALDVCIEADVWAHLKYHPMCHLSPEYYKYVTNATYCLLDNGEWDYGHAIDGDSALVETCKAFGAQFGIKGPPCDSCQLYIHCGGWNEIYANGYNGAGLKAVKERHPQDFGHYWYQNPVNVLFTGRNRK
jgi:MoaA/NifB/PqqE/SkfB family radical SAM enzyme